MNQWMYDTIVATINAGVPAIANDLVKGLQTLVEDYQAKVKEIEELKGQIEYMENNYTCPEKCEECDVEMGSQCDKLLQKNKKTK